jgi:hypothetical protein
VCERKCVYVRGGRGTCSTTNHTHSINSPQQPSTTDDVITSSSSAAAAATGIVPGSPARSFTQLRRKPLQSRSPARVTAGSATDPRRGGASLPQQPPSPAGAVVNSQRRNRNPNGKAEVEEHRNEGGRSTASTPAMMRVRPGSRRLDSSDSEDSELRSEDEEQSEEEWLDARTGQTPQSPDDDF